MWAGVPVPRGCGVGWTQASMTAGLVSGMCGGPLTLLCGLAGDELELIRPSIYRNVARQLNVSVQSETVVTDAFLAVATQIFSAGGSVGCQDAHSASVAQGLVAQELAQGGALEEPP